METKKESMEKEVHQLVEDSLGNKIVAKIVTWSLPLATAGIIAIAGFLLDIKSRMPMVEERTKNMEQAFTTFQQSMNAMRMDVQEIKQQQAVNQAINEERFKAFREQKK